MNVKKIAYWVFLFACVTVFNSCKKDKKQDVVIEYPLLLANNMEIDVKMVDTFVVRESIDFPTFLDGELSKNNTSKENIRSAKLTYMRIQVMDYAYSDTTKYCNLKDIAEMNMDIKKDGVGQAMVASKLIPDIRTKGVNLDVLDVELKEYLKQENFRMVFRYKKRREMPHEMPFIITVKFKITADPL